jgi:hypothetical protein
MKHEHQRLMNNVQQKLLFMPHEHCNIMNMYSLKCLFSTFFDLGLTKEKWRLKRKCEFLVARNMLRDSQGDDGSEEAG